MAMTLSYSVHPAPRMVTLTWVPAGPDSGEIEWLLVTLRSAGIAQAWDSPPLASAVTVVIGYVSSTQPLGLTRLPTCRVHSRAISTPGAKPEPVMVTEVPWTPLAGSTVSEGSPSAELVGITATSWRNSRNATKGTRGGLADPLARRTRLSWFAMFFTFRGPFARSPGSLVPLLRLLRLHLPTGLAPGEHHPDPEADDEGDDRQDGDERHLETR